MNKIWKVFEIPKKIITPKVVFELFVLYVLGNNIENFNKENIKYYIENISYKISYIINKLEKLEKSEAICKNPDLFTWKEEKIKYYKI